MKVCKFTIFRSYCVPHQHLSTILGIAILLLTQHPIGNRLDGVSLCCEFIHFLPYWFMLRVYLQLLHDDFWVYVGHIHIEPGEAIRIRQDDIYVNPEVSAVNTIRLQSFLSELFDRRTRVLWSPFISFMPHV